MDADEQDGTDSVRIGGGKHINELCNNRRPVPAATARILARVLGNSPDFWLNLQQRNDLWEAMNSPREREHIERAKPLGHAA